MAGAFLLTPGILTDIVGFSFMIPSVRRVLGKFLYKKFSKNISVSSFDFESHTTPHHGGGSPFETPSSNPNDFEHDGPTIDGEIIQPGEKNDNSPWA